MSKYSSDKYLLDSVEDSVKAIEHRLHAMERGDRQQRDEIYALAAATDRLEENQEKMIKQQRQILDLMELLLQQRQQRDTEEKDANVDRLYPQADIPHPCHQKAGKPGKWYLNQIVDRDYTAALGDILDQSDVSMELKKVKSLANMVMRRVTSRNSEIIGVKWSLLSDSVTSWMVEELEAATWAEDIAIVRCQRSWFAKNIMRTVWAQKVPRKVKPNEYTVDHDIVRI
jgi:hypothetical protein